MLPPTPSPTQTIIRETKSLLVSSEQFKQRTDVRHARRDRIGRLPGNGEFVNRRCERWDGRGCKNRWWAQRIEDLNRTQISAPWKQLLWRRSHYPEIALHSCRQIGKQQRSWDVVWTLTDGASTTCTAPSTCQPGCQGRKTLGEHQSVRGDATPQHNNA